jgi:hypothetical protein
MICSIMKWMISQSLDTERPLPWIVNHHIGRCGSCREFLAKARLIGSCLERDASRLERKPSFAEEKVHVVVPAVYSYRLAVLTVCVFVVGGFLAVHSYKTALENTSVLSKVTPNQSVTVLLSMSDISPETLAVGSESGLSNEINYLAQDAKSAAKLLAGSIGLNIVHFD